MPIFVSANATEINIPQAKPVKDLEAWSGADLVISQLAKPMPSRTLFRQHVESGAILCQVKKGEDLAASVGDRLNDSLARMHQCTRTPAQHWLVYVGTLGSNENGDALINGHRTHKNVAWATIEGAIVSWLARGGVWYPHIKHESQLAGWASNMERRLGQYNAQYYKYVLSTPEFPDQVGASTDVLQLPVRVRDLRRACIAFEGLGVELVNRSWEYVGGDFRTWLHFMTDEANAGKCEGIGLKKIQSVRKQCNLKEGDEPFPLIWESEANAKPPPSALQIAIDTGLLFPRNNGAKSKAH